MTVFDPWNTPGLLWSFFCERAVVLQVRYVHRKQSEAATQLRMVGFVSLVSFSSGRKIIEQVFRKKRLRKECDWPRDVRSGCILYHSHPPPPTTWLLSSYLASPRVHMCLQGSLVRVDGSHTADVLLWSPERQRGKMSHVSCIIGLKDSYLFSMSCAKQGRWWRSRN